MFAVCFVGLTLARHEGAGIQSFARDSVQEVAFPLLLFTGLQRFVEPPRGLVSYFRWVSGPPSVSPSLLFIFALHVSKASRLVATL